MLIRSHWLQKAHKSILLEPLVCAFLCFLLFFSVLIDIIICCCVILLVALEFTKVLGRVLAVVRWLEEFGRYL